MKIVLCPHIVLLELRDVVSTDGIDKVRRFPVFLSLRSRDDMDRISLLISLIS